MSKETWDQQEEMAISITQKLDKLHPRVFRIMFSFWEGEVGGWLLSLLWWPEFENNNNNNNNILIIIIMFVFFLSLLPSSSREKKKKNQKNFKN